MAVKRYRTKTITAQNQFTDWIALKQGGILTVAATAFTANIKIQRRGADGNAVNITDNAGSAITITAVGTYTINAASTPAEYRAGVETGGFTSATALVLNIEGR